MTLVEMLRLLESWQDAMCGESGPAARKLTAALVNVDVKSMIRELEDRQSEGETSFLLWKDGPKVRV